MRILLLGSDISFADKVFDSALKNGWRINHVKDLIAARLAVSVKAGPSLRGLSLSA